MNWFRLISRPNERRPSNAPERASLAEWKSPFHRNRTSGKPIFRIVFAGMLLFGGNLATVFSRFSPLLFILYGISRIRSEHSVDSLGIVSLLLGVTIGGLCVAIPRFFCRYLCPQGLIFGILRRLRVFPHRVFPHRNGRWLLGAPLAWFGRGLALAILFVAGFGILDGLPLVWGEPLVLFQSLRTGVSVLLIFCISLWTIELLLPRFWCRVLCPTGGIQELYSIPLRHWRKRHRQRKERQPGSPASPSREQRPFCEQRSSGRRRFLGVVSTVTVAGGLSSLRAFPARSPNRLRPPGAVTETKFASLCIRCGNCVDVCPTRLIRIERWTEFPELQFRPAYCTTDCVACGQACPVGAITSLAISEKTDSAHRIGVATLDWERCQLYEDHECRICVRECPHTAIEIVWSEEEYLPVPVIDPIRCSGCGRCVVFCPTESLQVTSIDST